MADCSATYTLIGGAKQPQNWRRLAEIQPQKLQPIEINESPISLNAMNQISAPSFSWSSFILLPLSHLHFSFFSHPLHHPSSLDQLPPNQTQNSTRISSKKVWIPLFSHDSGSKWLIRGSFSYHNFGLILGKDEGLGLELHVCDGLNWN